MSEKTGYILGISRGHNGGACLLKDGEIVFAIEEERLSRMKYDGTPFAAMSKVKEYTDKVDYIFVSHTAPISDAGVADFTGEDMYTSLARKLGLIDQKASPIKHPQVIDLSNQHHKIHAACAFYRSGFDDAVAVVVDGAGSCRRVNYKNDLHAHDLETLIWETESIISCEYPAEFKTEYKHWGTRDPGVVVFNSTQECDWFGEEDQTYAGIISGHAGIVKAYEATTTYCGFLAIEAGKTMGLFPYGKPNDKIPPLWEDNVSFPVSNRNVFVPTYPNGASVNYQLYSELTSGIERESFASEVDWTTHQNRRDMAYAVQKATQQQVANLIRSAVQMSGKKNVVLSGGYGLNCVANYHYLEELKDEGIDLYVEPISNDGGTAVGAALWGYYETTRDESVRHKRDIYLGFEYSYTNDDIEKTVEKYDATIKDATHEDVIDLITNKNIVALFQGRSEAGPRALGNRTLLFDPTFEDGKDFVNEIKRREYFRPFAGSILEEDVHEWFDLRGMDSTPHMMYAVNCQDGVQEKIPSIIHVDGTCRIQTVTREQNPHYYDIIKTFKDRTGVPIVFNTSFNLGGEPLVETLDDALRTLKDSEIEYLYLPEFGKLIFKGNWIFA